MYKIYINQKPLYLCTTEEHLALKEDNFNPHYRYLGKPKFILPYVDTLEKTAFHESVVLHAPQLEPLWEAFNSRYTQVAAAGGLVFNAQQEFLLIKRRGWWDLPKGKIDDGETRETAALREVLEETGVQASLGAPILTTWHTYRDKKERRILKPTFWYLMHTQNAAVKVQEEEDIEDYAWVKQENFDEYQPTFYPALLDVVKKGLALNA